MSIPRELRQQVTFSQGEGSPRELGKKMAAFEKEKAKDPRGLGKRVRP